VPGVVAVAARRRLGGRLRVERVQSSPGRDTGVTYSCLADFRGTVKRNLPPRQLVARVPTAGFGVRCVLFSPCGAVAFPFSAGGPSFRAGKRGFVGRARFVGRPGAGWHGGCRRGSPPPPPNRVYGKAPRVRGPRPLSQRVLSPRRPATKKPGRTPPRSDQHDTSERPVPRNGAPARVFNMPVSDTRRSSGIRYNRPARHPRYEPRMSSAGRNEYARTAAARSPAGSPPPDTRRRRARVWSAIAVREPARRRERAEGTGRHRSPPAR
jgi:hypothetical protein